MTDHSKENGGVKVELSSDGKRVGAETTATADAEKQTKPPFSFAAMIIMAIRSSPSERLILSDIYKYISEEFPFYKLSDHGWQNSVRHNLSMHKCFVKTARDGGGEHKGNYWSINPNGEDVFQDGDYRRRRKMKSTTKLCIVPPSGPFVDHGPSTSNLYAKFRTHRSAPYAPGPLPITSFASTGSQHFDSYSQCHQMSSLPPYNHMNSFAPQTQFNPHGILPLNSAQALQSTQLPPPPPPSPQQPTTANNSFSIHSCMNQTVGQQQSSNIDMQHSNIHHPHGNIFCYSYWPENKL